MAVLIPYVRTSTDDQENSVSVQKERIERYCEYFGHSLACDPIVETGVSGGVPLFDRSGGQELRSMLLAGGADGIVGTIIDRVFRRAVDGLQQADWFQKNGFELIFCDDQVDTSTPDGWLNFGMKCLMADWERRKIGYRTQLGMQQIRDEGRSNGHTPFGFVTIDGRLYRDPRTFSQRETIVALVNSPNGGSLEAICRELHSLGIKPPKGAQWHKSSVSRIASTHSEFSHIPDLPNHVIIDELEA